MAAPLLEVEDLRSTSRPRTGWSMPSTASPTPSTVAQTLGIVGESGSGESVLVHVLASLRIAGLWYA